MKDQFRMKNRNLKPSKTKLIVVTGGPGAGKTAVLEIAKKKLCPHVAILPESATILFSGGFWRLPSLPARVAAQKSIYYIQQEMENLVRHETKWTLGLCDRGSLDSLAYWPKGADSFWKTLQTNQDIEYSKYAMVLHLQTPTLKMGYNHQNPLRTESAKQALLIDKAIGKVWQDHPNYIPIPSQFDFLDKAHLALSFIENYAPICCK